MENYFEKFVVLNPMKIFFLRFIQMDKRKCTNTKVLADRVLLLWDHIMCCVLASKQICLNSWRFEHPIKITGGTNVFRFSSSFI